MITKPFLLSARLCAEHFTNGSPFNCHNCPELWNGVSELYFKDGETSPDRPPLEHRDPPPGSRWRFWAWHSRPLPLPTSFVLWRMLCPQNTWLIFVCLCASAPPVCLEWSPPSPTSPWVPTCLSVRVSVRECLLRSDTLSTEQPLEWGIIISTLRDRKPKHRIAKQLATSSQNQEEADLRVNSLELDFGWSPISSPSYGASRTSNLLLWEALLDLSCWVRPRNVPEPVLTGLWKPIIKLSGIFASWLLNMAIIKD